MAEELAGFPLAYSTWISQGGGLRSNKNGTMVYNSGEMKGMTRDQALMMFQNQIWPNASDEWKNEYTKRATYGMMSPVERDVARTTVTSPRIKAAVPSTATSKPRGVTTAAAPAAAVVSAPTSAPARASAATTTPTTATAVTPPQPKANQQDLQNYIINQSKPQVAGPKPIVNTSDTLTNDDMSGKGYTLIGNKGGVKKWRKNDAMPGAMSGAMPKTSEAQDLSAMPVIAAPIPNQPFSTRFDVNKGRVVATGGTPDESFERYDAAQERYKQGTQTKQDSAIVSNYIGRDALSRTPSQIAQDKAMDTARGRGGSNWQAMDLARRKATADMYQQQEAAQRAKKTALRNKEIEQRMTAVTSPAYRP
jgi:hypothetical protein